MAISDLLAALGLGDANQGTTMPAQTASQSNLGDKVMGLLSQLGANSPDGSGITKAQQAAILGQQPSLPNAISGGPGPMGFGSADATPPQQPQQAPVANQAAPAMQSPAAQQPQLQQQQVQTPPVAQAQAGNNAPDLTNGGASAPAATPADQSAIGAQVIAQAAQDPQDSQSLLQKLGSYASSLGDKLTHLSPAQSQALLAAGSQILSANNGTQNLGQLIGGGIGAGVNNYNQQLTNRANIIKAQSQAAKDQADARAALMNAAAAQTIAGAAANKPSTVAPGEGFITPIMAANGQTPQGAGTKVTNSYEFTDNNGNKFTQQYGYQNGQFGPVGAPIPKQLVDTGPLAADQRTVVNAAHDTAQQSATLLNHVQSMLTTLSPTMVDAQGNTVPNPQFQNIPGGASATVQQALASITGSPANGQVERQMIDQQIRQAQLQVYKAGVGGRLTNADIGILQKGLPPDNASAQYLGQWLGSYSRFLQDKATQDQASAAFVDANRGDKSPLRQPLQFNGNTYPAGTDYQTVISHPYGLDAAKPAQAQQQNAQQNPVVQKAITAARSGHVQAQQALKTYGIQY